MVYFVFNRKRANLLLQKYLFVVQAGQLLKQVPSIIFHSELKSEIWPETMELLFANSDSDY